MTSLTELRIVQGVQISMCTGDQTRPLYLPPKPLLLQRYNYVILAQTVTVGPPELKSSGGSTSGQVHRGD